MANFITNQKDVKTLKTRLRQLVEHSQELKFLSGFFYFSGWQQLYDSLKNRDDIQIKVLVGLEVDHSLGTTVELSTDQTTLSNEEKVDVFFQSLGKALNTEHMDVQEFHEQVEFFLQVIEEGRLQLRKTLEPNHAKLYLFKIKDALKGISDSKFITGSSNLTRAGVDRQNEFNVEISDYGTAEAEEYFDKLWEDAIPITENHERKQILLDYIKNQTQAADITPFEAYALCLKLYLDLVEQKSVKPHIIQLLESKGYKPYSYQLDAVSQALTVIEEHNGVIVADVVGLGKSVIASLIGKCLNKRGMIIAPPGLIGDDKANSGWQKYKSDFGLHDWEVRSSGKLEDVAEYLSEQGSDIEVIVVDEAHRYRNQDTSAYEALSHICRNRKVILLSATPFNNSPADIFALLKLFIVPGHSGITLDENIESRFAQYESLFRKLSFIIKNYQSVDENKRQLSENYYQAIFNELPINIKVVQNRSKALAQEIKTVIEPVLIRRNRIDLQKDYQYKKEVKDLPVVTDPQELLFELSPKQSEFYDKVIQTYFADDGDFKGAIYQPFNYEKGKVSEDMGREENREFYQQRNLYDFMRRLLVKRFESSFGAFEKTIQTFCRVHEKILAFIDNSGGKYILDRGLLEKIYEEDEENIEEYLEEYSQKLVDNQAPKNRKVYTVSAFQKSSLFLEDIKRDLALLKRVRDEMSELELAKNDPKAACLITHIQKLRTQEPARKVIIFSEYVDTVLHLQSLLEAAFGSEVLTVAGSLANKQVDVLNNNFDAGVKKNKQADEHSILIASDKISEGFNLNRAGAIINYDIPWNPTRVIQRVGRINRIGKKVFNELYLYNFFPTLQGSGVVKSREIAAQKMFLIHNTLGEDSKIFASDETPTASALFKKLSTYKEDEEESLTTTVRNRYAKITQNHPEVIERISKLPARVKTGKPSDKDQLAVLRRKGISLFAQHIPDTHDEKATVEDIAFVELLPLLECEIDEQKLKPSQHFWNNYEKIKNHTPRFKVTANEASMETKAHLSLRAALKNHGAVLQEQAPFIRTLLLDIKEYKTLPKYTLRRLAQYSLEPTASKAAISNFIKDLAQLRLYLGEDYLDQVKARATKHKQEMIVAVETVK